MKYCNSLPRLIPIVIIILALSLILPSTTSLAYTDGPNDAGLGENVPDLGTEVWQDPGNFTVSGSPYTTVNLYHEHLFSNFLQGTQYGFAIPTDVAITGIEITITRMSSGHAPSILDNVVSLVKDGHIVGANRASLVPWSTDLISVTYGGPNDLWGLNWTPDDINSKGFGVAVAAYRDNNGNKDRIATVNTMRITVYYGYPTSTTVECGDGSPITYGENITCKATVSRLASALTPTGTVKWASDGVGAFLSTTCTLSGDNGVASCSALYTPGLVGSGTHTITATYVTDDIFVGGSSTAQVSVQPRPASVTPDAISKVYGDADPVLSGSLTGFLTADAVSAVYSRTPGETVSGGPYTISAALSPEGALVNYEITYNTADFTITPKPASITPDALGKTYGDPDPGLTGTVSGFIAADNVTATYTREPGETVLAGPYTISATASPAGVLSNYDISYNTADFTITPKSASISPDPASKTYGDPDPAFTGTLSGFLIADNVTALYTRAAGETVLGGPYSISATGLPAEVLGNYDITYNTADFVINLRLVTVTADPQTKMLSRPDPLLTYTVTSGSLAFTDNFSGSLTRVPGEAVGTYAILQGTLGLNSNYTLTYVGANFTITVLRIFNPIIIK